MSSPEIVEGMRSCPDSSRYWLSYSKHLVRQPPKDLDRTSVRTLLFGLSVAIERPSAGTTLPLVPSQQEPLMKVIIVKDPSNRILEHALIRDFTPSLKRHPIPRSSLGPNRFAIPTLDSTPSIFTIVLQLRSDREGLVLEPLDGIDQVEPPRQGTFQRVYERTIQSRASYLTLRCSLRLVAGGSYRLPRTPDTLLIHSVRIKEVRAHSRSHYWGGHVLPQESVREIGRFLAIPYTGWRKSLLSMGLVSRSWSCVLDLVFEVDFSHPWTEKITISSLVKTLKQRSSKNSGLKQEHGMSIFDPNHFGDLNKHNQWDIYFHTGWRAQYLISIAYLLDGATKLRSLFLPIDVLHDASFLMAMGQMVNLHQVVLRVPIAFGKAPINKHGSSLGVDILLELIARWPKLKILEISEMRNYMETASDSDALDIGKHPSSPEPILARLQSLSLENVRIDFRQLWTFSQMGTTTLKDLTLCGVQGLTNRNLYEALIPLAPNLCSLSIEDCSFDISWKEDYALDLLIPLCTSLETLYLRSPVFSWITIAGKTQNSQPSLDRDPKPFLSIELNVHTCTKELVLKLPEALEQGAWRRVWFNVLAPPYRTDIFTLDQWRAVRKAKQVADERGIVLHISPGLRNSPI